MTLHNADAHFLRPILTIDPALSARGTVLAGGCLRFDELAVIEPDGGAMVVPTAAAAALYPALAGTLACMARPRPLLGSLVLDGPHALTTVALGDEAAPSLAEGATALIVTASPAGEMSAPEAVHRLSDLAPVILRGFDARVAAAGRVVSWQAPDWVLLEHATLPEGCLRLTPAPDGCLDRPEAVRRFFSTMDSALRDAEARGFGRSSFLIDLGRVQAGALTSLGLLHGLGCALLAEIDVPGGPHAAAAAAALLAGQGVQLMTGPDPAAIAAGLRLWRTVAMPAADGA